MLLSLTLLACLAPGDSNKTSAPRGDAFGSAHDSGGDSDTATAPADDTGRDPDPDSAGGAEDSGPVDSAPCPASWADADADGFGAGAPLVSCDVPAGRVLNAVDCDDTDGSVFPGAAETCDEVDQDCDGLADEDAVDGTLVYTDRDGDGFGDGGSAFVTCTAAGAEVAGDCDDADAGIGPGVPEVCEDGVDQDCDGVDRTCMWIGNLDIADADASFAGDAANMDFGERLADAGDLDGDGYSDLVVAAAGTPTGSRAAAAGSLWVLQGAPSFLGDGGAAALAELTFAGCLDDVSAAGDIDGDGYADMLVGQACAGAAGEGAAHLLYGDPSRLRSDADTLGDAVFAGTSAESHLGEAVATAGDVDGDGLDDFLLADATSVYLGYGDPSRYTGAVDASTLARWAGGAGASPGSDAAGITAGDLDGDGLRDLLAFDMDGRTSGADVPGEVHVLYGEPERHTGAARLADWDASFVGPTGAGTVGLGRVTLSGDLDGDGYDEVVAASSTHESSRGTVWVFSGTATRYTGDVPDTDADHQLRGSAAFAAFGSSATIVADLDGYDGAELLVGARGTGAWLFRGGARSGSYDTSTADAAFGGGAYVDDLGEAVAAPDLDGDTIPELLVGAPDTSASAGMVYLFLGASM